MVGDGSSRRPDRRPGHVPGARSARGRHGYGDFSLRSRETQELLGRVGLRHRPDFGVDLGFATGVNARAGGKDSPAGPDKPASTWPSAPWGSRRPSVSSRDAGEPALLMVSSPCDVPVEHHHMMNQQRAQPCDHLVCAMPRGVAPRGQSSIAWQAAVQRSRHTDSLWSPASTRCMRKIVVRSSAGSLNQAVP